MMIPTMSKRCCGLSFAVLVVSVFVLSSTGHAQQGIAGRAGEALDNVGRTIRSGVENAVATNNVAVYEQELLARVYSWGRSRESSHFRSRSVYHRQGASGLGWRYAHTDAARRAVRVECTE